MAEISALSNETVWQPVKLVHPTLGVQAVQSYPVHLALVADRDPVEADWFQAAWDALPDADGNRLAYLEVGPNGAIGPLVAGLYRVWVKLDLPTETPVTAGEFVVVY